MKLNIEAATWYGVDAGGDIARALVDVSSHIMCPYLVGQGVTAPVQVLGGV